MKKIILSALLSCIIITANSQNKKDSLPIDLKGNNEIKVNVFYACFGVISFSYERILSNECSLGLSTSFFLNKSFDYRSEYNPYFRFYVFGKKANGLFFEGDFVFANRNDYTVGVKHTEVLMNGTKHSYYLAKSIRNSYGVAVGLGLKFVLKKGYLLEINGAVGKLLGDIDGARPKSTSFLAGLDEIYVKPGISIGKRF